MPKGSPELTRARRGEIVAACAKLYETMRFKEITIKEIAKFTSFTRPSIYNYFQTKEEIFLALFTQEYEVWADELDSLYPSGKEDAKSEFAKAVAHTLERRERLLKLLSTNLSDMELNSRPENLVEFKVAYGASIDAVLNCLSRFCPELSKRDKQDFIASFFSFVYGIYPYAVISKEQKEAMDKAKVHYWEMSIFEIAYLGTKKLLGL